MIRALVCIVFVGCSSTTSDPPAAVACGEGTVLDGTTCVPAMAACPSDSHRVDDRCVADAAATYQVRVAPALGAEAKANRVVVFGTNADGTAALDPLVLTTDRPGAGVFARPLVTPTAIGTLTTFTPCDRAVPGCIGPVTIRAALASDPTTIVATTPTSIVEPIDVNPAKRCMTGGNVFHVEGNDALFTGDATYTNATWTFDATYAQIFPVHIGTSAGSWHFIFNIMNFATYLVPGVYEDARLATTGAFDHPFLFIQSPSGQCDSIDGRFEVVEYVWEGTYASKATFTFKQFCNGSTTSFIEGCLHYEQ